MKLKVGDIVMYQAKRPRPESNDMYNGRIAEIVRIEDSTTIELRWIKALCGTIGEELYLAYPDNLVKMASPSL